MILTVKEYIALRNRLKQLLFVICLCVCITVFIKPVYASSPTDEITEYTIKVDVNEDATLNIYYHIEWTVLESDSVGPLEWVKVGVPNNHTVEYQALSDTISSMSLMSSGGSYVRIDLDRKYYEGESVNFDFMIVQDYVYQMNKLEDGYTVYTFTPGWFDDMDVDHMKLMWNSDKAYSFTPECFNEDGYYVWEAALHDGEKYTVAVTYPNDAFDFIVLETAQGDSHSDAYDTLIGILAVFFMILFIAGPVIIYIVVKIIKDAYYDGAIFGVNTEKKVTRTKITYYPNCTSCGAVRGDGETVCSYCGKSFIKSEEVISEQELKTTEKEAAKYHRDGEFRYTSSPDVFIRVHTTHIPRPKPTPVVRTTTSRYTTSHHSSCVHSSCACACACACAGGGRAGCSTKDFYNTNLKLTYFKKLKK